MKIPTRNKEKSSQIPENATGKKIPVTSKKSVSPPQIKQSGQIVAGTTAENEDISSPARRRIDRRAIEAVAAMVSRGLTESEACRQLNIRPKTFFNFKATRKNDERFAELLEKFRSARIEDLIKDIEKSAKGIGMKQRDWRASKFLLEVLDRQRFNTDRPVDQATTIRNTTNNVILIEAVKRAYAQVLAAEPSPAALPPATTVLNGTGQPEPVTNDSKPVETVSVFTDAP
jgi:hypothetical protein